MTNYEAKLKKQEDELKAYFSLYDEIKIKIKELQDIINDKQPENEGEKEYYEAEMKKLVRKLEEIVSNVRRTDKKIDIIKDIIKDKKKALDKDKKEDNPLSIKGAMDAITGLVSKIDELKETILDMAPELPGPSDVVGDITSSLTDFQTTFTGTLNGIVSTIQKDLLG